MIGSFEFHNPTKVIFGRDALSQMGDELAKYGDNVLLVYGGGSIKKNGIYDDVIAILNRAGKNVTEYAGVKPNPTTEQLREATNLARECAADFILAVGGGSVCDLSKAVSAAVGVDDDPWDALYVKRLQPTWDLIPVGCVLTMVGTGSEMNNVAVVTNHETLVKTGCHFGPGVGFPVFSVLNPEYTMSLPRYQMVAGIYDIFNHLTEQYFSGDDVNTTDYINEGLMRAVIDASRVAIADPMDYEARSNLMWAATMTLNDMLKRGKTTDFMCHKMGQTVAVFKDATHGMTLSAVTMPYYRMIMDCSPAALDKFKRFAINVWGVRADEIAAAAADAGGTPDCGAPAGGASACGASAGGASAGGASAGSADASHALDLAVASHAIDLAVASAGLDALEAWMNELGVVMHLSELGVTEDMIDAIADAVIINRGGYKILTRDEVAEVLRQSL